MTQPPQPPKTVTDPWVVLDISDAKIGAAAVRLAAIPAISVTCKGFMFTDGDTQVCVYSTTSNPPVMWWYGKPAGCKLVETITELASRNKMIVQEFQPRDMNKEWIKKFEPEIHLPLAIQYAQQNEGNPPSLETILSWNMDPSKISASDPVNALFQCRKQLHLNAFQ